jgi:hypothetical protein
MFIFNYALQPFKAYYVIWVRHSNFRHQASPRDSTQQQRVELWARNVREFCLNADFHLTFRDLLHAVKLRHGTDCFTFPLKECVLRIFVAQKIRRLRLGANPRTWGTKGQHATSRPQKPLAAGLPSRHLYAVFILFAS